MVQAVDTNKLFAVTEDFHSKQLHSFEHHTSQWIKTKKQKQQVFCTSYHVSNHCHGEDKYGGHGPYVSCPACAIDPHWECHQPFGKLLRKNNKQNKKWKKKTGITSANELNPPILLFFSPWGMWQPGRTLWESAVILLQPQESHS